MEGYLEGVRGRIGFEWVVGKVESHVFRQEVLEVLGGEIMFEGVARGQVLLQGVPGPHVLTQVVQIGRVWVVW